jgi:hypothetical protein
MISTNSRLASPASQLAEYLAQQVAYKNMFVEYYSSQKWEAWQVELLKKYMPFL